MGGFLGELSKKLAERWLTLLVLPGALYLAVAAIARTLGRAGPAHALDVGRVTAQVTAWAKDPAATTAGGQVVLVAGILAGAAAAGLAAQALGSGVERLALASGWHGWPRPLRSLAQRRVENRRKRWKDAHDDYHRLYGEARTVLSGAQPDQQEVEKKRKKRHAAFRTRTRIALEEPDRPTWMGDRVHAVTLRLRRDLNLDLPTVWPVLWLHLPDTARSEITAARQALARAATLGGWAVLYLLLLWWWWPALPISVVVVAIAWRRTRTAVNAYATLVEAAVRLHVRDLAEQIGVDPAGKHLPALGDTLTHRLRSEPPGPV
ncbi:hypothetical protein [Actinomadura sp.]|uniref:hypothetical protein n=1 Tax=Actinomadura sp. TaxID=1989 RepID=UPI0037CC08AF